MCAIAGILSKNGPVNFSEEIAKMASLLKHRGPDFTGFFTSQDKRVYLGFNRLSIVDLSSQANQPMFNEDKSLVLMINGEIYNYLQLRKELETAGHRFISASDSETVLHAYEQWGDSCVEHLRGMFAFTIWDVRNKKLFLARDRIGIKPLYYLENSSVFCFASEIKAFLGLSHTIWKPQIKKDVLDMYFSFPFIMDNENTLLENVKKIPPAHIGVFENGILKLKRYWRLEKRESAKISFTDALEQTEQLLKEAVECHFIGDVPIALMLSGGLDSSLIGALALRCNKRIELALTAGHTNFALDERKYGRLAAGHLGLKHLELEIDPREVADKIEDFVWYFDDLSHMGFFYQIYMAKKINELGLKVILVGQGADEIFGGYHIFKLSTFPFSVLPSGVWNMFYYRLLTGKKIGRDYLKYSSLIKKGIFHFGKDVHNICSDFEIEHQLPNYNLISEDRGFMSHSVESRVPYLDHKVVEFVYNLPQSYKLKGYCFTRGHGVIKYILRKIAARYLPDEIWERKKQGAALSISEVIKCDEEKVKDYLFDPRSMARQLFNKKVVESAFKDYNDNKFFIFRLYIFEIWSRQYLSPQRGGN